MIRPPALHAMTLLLTGSLALSATPALAGVELIPRGQTLTGKQTETRVIQTMTSAEYRGAKQLTKTVPYTEERITGPTTKLIKELEDRTYQTPVTRNYVNRQETREASTYRNDYTRRTTSQVLDRSWNIWKVGGYATNGFGFQGDLVNVAIASDGDYRRASRPWMPSGRIERSQEEFNRANVVAVKIDPYGTGFLNAYLVFDKNTLGFLGGAITCHGSDKGNPDFAKIPTAHVRRYADHDSIVYQLNCSNNETWWKLHCDTDKSTWEVHLDGKLLASQTLHAYRTVTTEEPYSDYTVSYTPWAPTGVTMKGAPYRPTSTNRTGFVRHETTIETVLMAQHTAVNGANAAKGIAAAALDARKVFSGDSSSGKGRATLSGTHVRQTLGANRVKASQVAGSSHGSSVPDARGGVPGLGLGNNGQGGSSGASAGAQADAVPPSAPPAVPVVLPVRPPVTVPVVHPVRPPVAVPVVHPVRPPVAVPAPVTTPSPTVPDSWWFPQKPSTPPPRVRYQRYDPSKPRL